MAGTLGKSNLKFGLIPLGIFLVAAVVSVTVDYVEIGNVGMAGFVAFGPIAIIAYIWFWIWAIIAIGNIAEAKGYSKGGFIVFAVFLPVIALIVALVLQPSQARQASVAAATLVKCPACAELVQPDAKKCRHCGEVLVQQ